MAKKTEDESSNYMIGLLATLAKNPESYESFLLEAQHRGVVKGVTRNP